MPLVLAPLTPSIHEQIVGLHKARGLLAPPYPKLALVVTTENWEVVTSVYLYEAAPWLFAEFAMSSPAFQAKTIHIAGVQMIRAMVAMAAAKGLAPFAAPRVRGIEMMLRRAGFAPTGTQMWVANVPSIPLSADPLPTVEIKRTATSTEPKKMEAAAQEGDHGDQTAAPSSVPPKAPKLKKGRVRRKKDRTVSDQ